MRQAFRDLCREELGQRGINGLIRLWMRTLTDLTATALTERSETMRRKLLMPLALVVGLLIALVDASPSWGRHGDLRAGGDLYLRVAGRCPPGTGLAIGPSRRLVGSGAWDRAAPELRILGGFGRRLRGGLHRSTRRKVGKKKRCLRPGLLRLRLRAQVTAVSAPAYRVARTHLDHGVPDSSPGPATSGLFRIFPV